MKLSKLLATGKTSGLPAHIHVPWKKARIFPMTFSNKNPRGIDPLKITQGQSSGNLESGMFFKGSFLQNKEPNTLAKTHLRKVLQQIIISKKPHAQRISQSSTNSIKGSSSDGKASVSQTTGHSERESNSLETGRKAKVFNNTAIWQPCSEKNIGISSTHTCSNKHQEVAYMSSFDSDEEQGMSKDSDRDRQSKTMQEDSKGESKTDKQSETDQGSETETETERETEIERKSISETASDTEKESDNEKKSQTESKKETKTTEETRDSISVGRFQLDNSEEDTPSSFGPSLFSSSWTASGNPCKIGVAEDYSSLSSTSTSGRDSEENQSSEEGLDEVDETKCISSSVEDVLDSKRNKAFISHRKSFTFEDSSRMAGNTKSFNLSQIAEDEEEEMTAAEISDSNVGNRFQVSADGTESPEEKEEEEEAGSETDETDKAS